MAGSHGLAGAGTAADRRPEARGIQVVRTIAELRRIAAGWRRGGMRIGVVQTMGALHEGHLALVRQSNAGCDRTMVTLFVNPLQFGAGEDYESYPRQEDADVALLATVTCDVLFAPAVEEMFPDPESPWSDFQTAVTVRDVTRALCGRFRPGHFDGMATEVTKMLNITASDVAYFGEKDFQQLQTVRRMVRDLNMPVEIVGVPTVREPDGLAVSSRNVYLSATQRRIAPRLYSTLTGLANEVGTAAGCGAQAAAARSAQELLNAGFDRVDYVDVVDADTVGPVDGVERPARACAAAWLGRCRLIDNVPVHPSSPSR